jgi:hypothetical protein
VSVAICPPRRGNRKGVVEKANHVAAQRWWRTLAKDLSVEQAQASLDRWRALRGDAPTRPTGDAKATVATLAAAEPLASLPVPFPATLRVVRTASAQALVSFRGNQYSVPPELARAQVAVHHRLGAAHLEIATANGISSGTIIARHCLATPGAGATVRDSGHVLALERAALAAFTTAAPHRSKQRIPPGPAAATLRSPTALPEPTTAGATTAVATTAVATTAVATTAVATTARARAHGEVVGDVVVDLNAHAAAAHGRNTLR